MRIELNPISLKSKHSKNMFVVALACISLTVLYTGCMEKERMVEKLTLDAERFAYIGGSLHGIEADKKTGTIFAGKAGNTIIALSGNAEESVFTVIPGADGRYQHGRDQVYLFDLHRLEDGSFLGAAKDRILSIDASGTVSTIIDGLFDGTYGVCGITMDKNGMIYFSINGRGLYVLETRNSEPQQVAAVPGIIGVELSPNRRYVYACDGLENKLIIVDTLKKRETKEIQIPFLPEYLMVEGQHLYVKGPIVETWLVFDITKQHHPVLIKQYDVSGVRKHSYGIQTSVLIQKNDTPVIYGTCWDSGEVYSIPLPTAK